MKRKFTLLLASLFITGFIFAQTYDNGPLSTGATTKSGVAAPSGFEWSEVQNDAGNTTVSNRNSGFAAVRGKISGTVIDFSLADDFTIPVGETWDLTDIDFFAYRTGFVGTVSPFTDIRVQIWNAAPGSEGAAVIAGDMTTNIFATSVSAGLYRIFNTQVPAPGTPPGTTRKVWKTNGTFVSQLTAGTYWVEWQFVLPNEQTCFVPTITIPGQRTVAGMNAKQKIALNTWQNVLDSSNIPLPANTVALDMPFVLHYTKLLPVTFLNFDGAISNGRAALKWSTATELNNKGFDVERSIDGQNFSSVGFVQGHGNSTVVNNYTFDDSKLPSGTLYYRLKQTDLDGQFTYSKTIPLHQENKFSWNIYPNPVTANSWIQLELATSSKVSIQVAAVSGKLLQAIDKGVLAPGTYSVPLNLNNVAKGTYFVKLMVGDKTYSQTIIK